MGGLRGNLRVQSEELFVCFFSMDKRKRLGNKRLVPIKLLIAVDSYCRGAG